MKKKSFINPLDVCFSQFFISFLSAIDNYEMINGIVLSEVCFVDFFESLNCVTENGNLFEDLFHLLEQSTVINGLPD